MKVQVTVENRKFTAQSYNMVKEKLCALFLPGDWHCSVLYLGKAGPRKKIPRKEGYLIRDGEVALIKPLPDYLKDPDMNTDHTLERQDGRGQYKKEYFVCMLGDLEMETIEDVINVMHLGLIEQDLQVVIDLPDPHSKYCAVMFVGPDGDSPIEYGLRISPVNGKCFQVIEDDALRQELQRAYE